MDIEQEEHGTGLNAIALRERREKGARIVAVQILPLLPNEQVSETQRARRNGQSCIPVAMTHG
jgi:hypothetical protein